MLTANDERYLGQGTMQLLLCLLGSQCFCEKLIKQVEFEPAKPAIPHLEKAAEEMMEAYRIFTDGVADSQIQRLARFNKAHRVALVSEASPEIHKVPMIMDWSHAKVLVDTLNEDVCKLCDKDRDGVRACEIRKAVYDIGGVPDEKNAKINEWCEISRGIL